MAIFADDAPHVAGSVIMLTAVAFITYALRVYCRLSRRSWGAEDWIMTSAVIPFCVLTAGCLGGAFNGIGVHSTLLNEPENQRYQAEGQKYFLIFEVGYVAAIIPIKLSISWMLIRVAEGRKLYINIQYGVIAMFATMNIIALIFILINCTPPEAAWNTSLLKKGASCRPAHVLTDIYYATTAVNIVTDWVTALMPIPLLWRVQLDRNTKISIIGLMGLGILASLSACIRLKYTVNLQNQADFLFAVANVVIWGFAENAIGMIVGNVATLRPLFRSLFERTIRSKGYGSHSHRTGPSRFAASYELSGHGKSANNTFTTSVVERGVHGKNRDSYSQLSDGDSQKQIIQNDCHGHADIMVSRQVNITYE
ncbi:hypothetical protein BDV35DRAFT_357132 [Aspergillus flavus]|uniref:Rhodopsin domain-containing protein n=1 Tax=Aspergillus flavus TaxID=5059 RepID=A0A5N6GU02_ASPFL|nr:hypothetical protein BDV35DRAFT_357132 [Aspergillus flavus]KAJ1715445.1 hypothetical protein NYO67_2340 [Aspergillus flavus]KOC09995.1 hypothetical protein AFLA70_42g004001 [Aspergillus flavus AF70]RAQ58190.1 hypothetical protein COH20_007842 [Aspergillus flavus]RAQ67070.1 hypothetical protein COH21_007818 [Aspergillus flavus]